MTKVFPVSMWLSYFFVAGSASRCSDHRSRANRTRCSETTARSGMPQTTIDRLMSVETHRLACPWCLQGGRRTCFHRRDSRGLSLWRMTPFWATNIDDRLEDMLFSRITSILTMPWMRHYPGKTTGLRMNVFPMFAVRDFGSRTPFRIISVCFPKRNK